MRHNATTTQDVKDDVEAKADVALDLLRGKTPKQIATIVQTKLNSGDPDDTKQVIEYLARAIVYLLKKAEKV